MKTTTVETVAEKRRWVLFEKITSGVYFQQDHVDSHLLMILYMNADLSDVTADLNAVARRYAPFTIVWYGDGMNMVGTTYYFAYTVNVQNGMRPDKYGTFSGQVSISVELVNKMQGEITTVGG